VILSFVVGAARAGSGARRAAGKGAVPTSVGTAEVAAAKATATKGAVWAGRTRGGTGGSRKRSHRHKTDAVLVVDIFDFDF